MRILTTLLGGLVAVSAVVLGIGLWTQSTRQDELMAVDLEEQTNRSRVIQECVGLVRQHEGDAAAQRFVERANAGTPRIGIRWVPVAALAPFGGHDLQREVAEATAKNEMVRFVHHSSTGEGTRYTYLPVPGAKPDDPPVVVELTERLAAREAFIRGTLTRDGLMGLAFVLLNGLITIAIASRFIDRPARMLRDAVRAIGEGRMEPRVVLRHRDAFGDLAQEINSAGERLANRERIRHADRLRTVGQLASGVAHELGTPLSVIAVRARLIASGEATGPDVVANADAILGEQVRMTAIVRQLLGYSRQQGARMTLVDLRQVANRAAELLETLAEQRNVTVDVQAPERPLLVRADDGQLQQVLANLIMNGMQAMTEGGHLRLILGRGAATPPAQSDTERGDYVLVSVVDEGPGIPPEHLTHIFEPFFTTKPPGDGTGLGLSVAEAIVHEHGGWITVENEPTHGARFTVFLAAADEQAAVAELAS